MTAVFRDGVDPLTDDALGRPYGRFDDGKRHALVGYDLTFTAPKSVSVLWALADDATRVIVYDAHRAALASSLEFVEQRVIRTRIGEAGRHQVRTRGMVAAAFDHGDTRASDPTLHTSRSPTRCGVARQPGMAIGSPPAMPHEGVPYPQKALTVAVVSPRRHGRETMAT